MDRFAATGLVFEAVLQPDRRIAVVAARQTEARDALEAVATAASRVDAGDLVERVRRTNGDGEISFLNGSRILFRSARQSLRGRALDAIFVHPDVPRHVLAEDQWVKWCRENEPCLQARHGELLLAW